MSAVYGSEVNEIGQLQTNSLVMFCNTFGRERILTKALPIFYETLHCNMGDIRSVPIWLCLGSSRGILDGLTDHSIILPRFLPP